MSREDVIRMARDVADKDKVDPISGEPPFVVLTPEELERFYDAAFKAGAESMRADAERYRWPTGDDHDTAGRDALFTITARLPFAGKGHVDAAIDAARGAT